MGCFKLFLLAILASFCLVGLSSEVWAANGHQSASSAVELGTSGTSVSIYLGTDQATLIDDDSTGWSVCTTFPAATSSSPVTFSAATIGGGTSTSLGGLLATGDTVLGGWTFSAISGYTAGDPVYLSFNVGAAQSLDDLLLWQYGGDSWTTFSAGDLTYDRTYASFTVNDLGTYAVTGDLVLAGDANRDGSINGTDLNTALSNYHRTGATWAMGDFDGDGQVSNNDLRTAIDKYNRRLASSAAAVPEPATLTLLLALAVVGLALRVCKRGQR
jgi:hypothetical protein